MHHLPLLLLTLISIAGFGQQLPGELPRCEYTLEVKPTTGIAARDKGIVKPDTLRALIIVTLSTTRGIAHARVGYVVLGGEKVVYLDCRKQPLKLPAKGWGWEVINFNVKLK